MCLYSSSRHILLRTLLIPRTSSFPRKDTMVIRRLAILIIERCLPLVQLQLTIGDSDPHHWMSRGVEGCRLRHIRLIVTYEYHPHQVTFARRIQCVLLRRAFHSVNSLWERITHLWTALYQALEALRSLQLPVAPLLRHPCPTTCHPRLQSQQLRKSASVQMSANYQRSMKCMLAPHFRPQRSVSNWQGNWTCLLEAYKFG